MKEYTGEFRSLRTNQQFTVNIFTEDGSSRLNTQEITLGPEPFTVDWNGGDDTIYTPIKSSSATIQIVSDTSYFDLYSSKAKQNRVELRQWNDLQWVGYTTPNSYSTPYDHDIETYEVECLDALGILQYMDYTPVNGTKSFVSFADIINHILKSTNVNTRDVVNAWYWMQNIRITDSSYGVGRFPESCIISEQNFFNEEDEPMKMNEVLEEICKFCGCTAICDKTNVMFIDYDAVRAAPSSIVWSIYSIDNSAHYMGTASSAFSQYSYNITQASFRESGTRLSQEMTYSKVKIKDSLYSFDSIIPSMFESEDLKNIKGYPWDTSLGTDANWNDGNKGWFRGSKFIEKKKVEGYANTFNFRNKYYLNENYIHHFYTKSGSSVSIPPYAQDYTITSGGNYTTPKIMNDYVGAVFCKSDTWVDNDKHNSYNFSDYLLLILNDSSNENQKLIEVDTSKYSKPFFISNKAKGVITGSMQVDDRAEAPARLTNYDENWDAVKMNEDCYLKLGLAVNGKSLYSTENNTPYWANGTNNTFRIFFGNSEDDSDIEESFYGHEFSIKDTSQVSDNAPKAGFVFSFPDSSSTEYALIMKPQLSIYGRGRIYNSGDKDKKRGYNYEMNRIWIKDFDLILYMPYEGGKDENDTDTEYEYTIDENYVSEMRDVDFKICTWDGKKPNYSAVAYMTSNGQYKFVDQLRCVTSDSFVPKRSEELMGYRLVEQYKNPMKRLEITLTADGIHPYSYITEPTTGGVYIVDKMTKDYVSESCRYTLIEKAFIN